MSAVKFSHKLLWIRKGASPELDSPNCLFELHAAEGEEWTLDPAKAAQLLKTLHLHAAADDVATLEGNDIFAAFAVFALLLQRRAGHEVRHYAVLRRSPSLAHVAVAQLWPPLARTAADLAAQFVEIVCGKFTPRDEDIVKAMFAFLKSGSSGPIIDHRYLHAAAIERGIPVVLRPPSDMVFGYGRHQKQLHWLHTDLTSHLAARLANNKTQTLDALQRAGLPVPEHVPVADAAEARKAAEKLGFPVVVKPVNTDHGVGITVGVVTASAVEKAYQHARTFSAKVAVEKFVPGETFRILVVNGKFIAAACTQPTPVIGDGRSTVRELVTRINLSPMRGPRHLGPLTWLEIDDEALGILATLSLTPESVLPFGRTIRLRTASNLGRGGQSVAVTDLVHPDNKAMAEACARVTGLDMAGIDFRSEAIDKSWRDGHGAVIEVNPSPGFRMLTFPARGPAADIATPIFNLLFPEGVKSRIPIVAVTGTNGKTTVTRLIAHVLSAAGLVTGVTTTEETMVDGRVVERGDCAGANFARRVLAVPTVEAAVLETARGGIIKYGLGFDRCSVAVVTNVAADHLGQDGVETIEDIAKVKLTVPRHADAAVLNADDGHCLAMRGALQGKRIILFSTRSGSSAVREHLAAGGTAYVRDGGSIVRHEGARSTALIGVTDLPVTFGGNATHNVANVLAALAALHALGMDDETVCGSARNFRADHSANPGRLNRIPGLGFDLYFDYAHNKPAFEAMIDFVSRLSVSGRRICVVTMPAARISDAVACDAMAALAGHFDHYVTCNNDFAMYRRDGFPSVLQRGLVAAGVREDMITAREGVDEAIGIAVDMARDGDLVMVLVGEDPEKRVMRVEALASRTAEKAST